MPLPPPVPGSPEELAQFARLQQRLGPLYKRLFPERREPRTVLVLPSLSLHPDELKKIAGVHHYEERLLCMLLLLRLPRAQVIYVTSQPLAPAIIDYYLHLLPGIPSGHARRRLTLLSCHDGALKPLAQKILERPRLLERLRAAIPDVGSAHMTCFVAGALERTLAVHLDVPLYACDPAIADLGSKSGSREIFRQAGVDLPDGFERLRDEADVRAALVELKRRQPPLRKAVVKLNEGFSGEGNAMFSYDGCPDGTGLESWVERQLAGRLRFEAAGETPARFFAKFAQMGGVVESFIDGETVRSPSVQCRIDPLGGVELISTHEQVLGGPGGHIFLGCAFPALAAYRTELQEAGRRVAEALRDRAALGRLGVDFIAVQQNGGWRLYAIEINLRKGGTTHTFMMLQYLIDGYYDPATGLYLTPTGQPRYYYATDNLQNPRYCGLTPDDLIDIAVDHNLHFHGATQKGVMFHLIGALSEFGKLGMVCVADSEAAAYALYQDTVATLDQETGAD